MPSPSRVILAYDGSDGAKHALEDLKRNQPAVPSEAEILVLCVAEVWTAARFASFGPYGLDAMPMTEAQRRMLEDAEGLKLKQARRTAFEAAEALRVAAPGWKVRAESSAGTPAWGIVKRAEAWNAGLIVLGSHGRSTVARMVRGSVSQLVVREAHCTVRVVQGRLGRRDAPASLVIGLDGSPDAEAAVQSVAERAWPAGSAVHLVTVVPDPLSGMIPTLPWMATRELWEAAWMRRMIEDPAERLRAAGLSVTAVTRQGDPRRTLIEEAGRRGADGLFVGARGVRGLRRFLLGSVSAAVAMRAPCPVEVVRPQGWGALRGSEERRAATQPAAAGIR